MDQSLILDSALKKAKIRIIPFIILLYVIASLDRANIGFAALQMNSELAISAAAFGFISGIFNITYALFEIPSNILSHRFGARTWIARIMITWGIIATLTAFVHSSTQLGVIRILLGMAEAGLFPGVVYYLTYWFPARERAKTVALFMLAMPISFIIGGPISTWLMTNITWAGLSGWRWMFFFEGIPAFLVGIITLFYIKNKPEDAKWLTKEEADSINATLLREKEEEELKLKISDKNVPISNVFKDLRAWRLAFIFALFCFGVVIVNFWLPQIIKGLSSSLSTQTVGWLTMIPYVVAVCIAIPWSRHSDKTGERKYHTALPPLFQIVGLLIIILSPNPVMKFIGITIFVGFYICIHGSLFSLPPVLYSGAALAVTIALINTTCSLLGFFSTLLFGILQGIGPAVPYIVIAAASFSSFLLTMTLGEKDLPPRSKDKKIQALHS